MVSKRGEDVIIRVTRSDLPQQVYSIADRLGLRSIQGAAQKVLRGAVLTFLPDRRKRSQAISLCGNFCFCVNQNGVDTMIWRQSSSSGTRRISGME